MKMYVKSNKQKYFANMVNGSEELNYSPEFRLYDNEYKYYVAGYYDDKFRGLADSLLSDNFSEIVDKANEFASHGFIIEIKNLFSGRRFFCFADEWLECEGDIPEPVYKLL